MPFTLSHPAAAVPFIRFGLPLSALVVGSMAPDFLYLTPFSTSNQYGHTGQGLFLFCIPAGLAVLWLFHKVLKLPLLSLLPARHQARLVSEAKPFSFGRFLPVLLALLLGSVTHIVWDSLTHAGGWTVQHVPLLRLSLLQTSHGTLYLFKVLQHGSSLAGAALLIIWYRGWFLQAEEQKVDLADRLSDDGKNRLLLSMALVACLGSGLYSILTLPSFSGLSWLPSFTRNLIITGIGILVVEVVVFSCIWHVKASRNGGR